MRNGAAWRSLSIEVILQLGGKAIAFVGRILPALQQHSWVKAFLELFNSHAGGEGRASLCCEGAHVFEQG